VRCGYGRFNFLTTRLPLPRTCRRINCLMQEGHQEHM
jgi:hypothetical protein